MGLISLVSKAIADPAMKATLNKIESVGKNHFFFHMTIKALLLRYLTAEESGQTPNLT